MSTKSWKEIEIKHDAHSNWKSLPDSDDLFNVPYTPNLLEHAHQEYPGAKLRVVEVVETRTVIDEGI